MDAMNMNKSDLKFLLVTTSILPILCFVCGFYIANFQAATSLDSAPATQHKMDNKSVAVSIPDIEKKQPTVIDDTASPVFRTHIREMRCAPTTNRYIVQAGMFSVLKNAEKLSNTLTNRQIDTQIIDDTKDGSSIFRVIVGSFRSKEIAQALLQDIKTSHSINLYLTKTNSKSRSNCIVSL